jgi:5-formyltetrahydrofolate cyclo-ligase
MSALMALGHGLALPVMQGAGRPLIFRQWAEGDALAPGPFQVQQPLDHSPRVVPDVVLVPLLAFDAQGWRLGYGGGFYDRTLDELRGNPQVRSVGVAFNAQKVAEVPRDAFDRPLDGILTETGLVWMERV